MNSFFQTLAFTYLLYPILGLLLVGLGIFIAKKNALLNNKRLVGYTIGAITLLTLPDWDSLITVSCPTATSSLPCCIFFWAVITYE